MLERLATLVELSGHGGPRFDDGRSAERPLGFLSHEDALGIATDWLLPVDAASEYAPLRPEAVVHANGCAATGPSDVTAVPGPFGLRRPVVGFSGEPAESLSTEELRACERTIERLRGILARVPAEHPLRGDDAVKACARRHVGRCELCGAEITRVGIQVRLDVGGVRVEREYGLLSE